MHDLIATTAFGLESVVVRELAAIGHDAKPISTGRVLFRGGDRAVADANLWLRAADRLLIRVAHFEAKDFDALFEGVKALAWERWIPRDFAFPVNGRSVKSQLSSVPAVQRTVKKAIVERLMSAHKTATLPETGPVVTIEIALLDNMATLTIDTTGDGLHKRGYRPFVGEAAMKETLAAGLILLSAWRPERPLIDPFCGTGTIAIEAAMIGRHIAPGLKRAFDAEKWPAIDASTWAAAREDARAKATDRLPITIHATDIDDRALGIARKAAAAAGVERDVHFAKRAFDELSTKADYGCIITNPPYGVRIGEEEDVERLYRQFPIVLRRLPTWSFHIITARQDLEELVGQRASRRRKLFNSQIECTYFTFLGPKPPSMRKDGAGAERGAADERGLTQIGTDSSGDQPEESHHKDTESTEMNQAEFVAADEQGSAPVDSTQISVHPRSSAAASAPAFGGLRDRDLREAKEFGACLANNARHLRRYPSRGITCYRLYERDFPDVPLIIDRYENRIHVAEYEREHSRTIAQQADWYDLMRTTIAQTLELPEEHVYMKEKRRQRGLTQHEKVSDSGETFSVQEGGLRFLVNLADYIDTGLFLDHRLTRGMVREQSKDARVLNLFCYTGSFSVYAAAGGAKSTVNVDLSNTYLEWARRNLELNGFKAGHRTVKSDVLEFLSSHPRGEHYDLVIVDPPTFSNSKSTEVDWEVSKGYIDLLTRLAPLMSPRGVIYFSTNYRRFKLDEEALAAAGLSAREISTRTVPPEYRNKRIHRCWRMHMTHAADTPNPHSPKSGS